MAKRVPHYDEKNIPAHAGDLYDFGDVKLEVYSTCEEPELYGAAPLRDDNNQSFIFAFHIGEQKVLFVGDAYHGAEQFALEIAAGHIRADICQIGHHGRVSHKDDLFYSLVAPKVALWPACYAQIDNDLAHRFSNTWVLGELSTVVDHYVAFDGTQTLTFPYEIQNLPYRSPLNK
jgi:beta-lactamase superfamily II metal-dependent hydrolase